MPFNRFINISSYHFTGPKCEEYFYCKLSSRTFYKNLDEQVFHPAVQARICYRYFQLHPEEFHFY